MHVQKNQIESVYGINFVTRSCAVPHSESKTRIFPPNTMKTDAQL